MPPKPNTAGSARDMIAQINPTVNLVDRNRNRNSDKGSRFADIPKGTGQRLGAQKTTSQKAHRDQNPAQTPVPQSSKAPSQDSNFQVRAKQLKTVSGTNSGAGSMNVSYNSKQRVEAKNVDRTSHLK